MKIFRVTMVLMFVVFWVGLAAAGENDAALKKEIKDFVENYTRAFQEKNMDAIMAMYAEDAVLLGTGPGERYEGSEEIRNAYTEYFNTFDKEEGTLTWYKAGHQGDVVWAAGMSRIRSYLKNVEREFGLNWTLVLSKRDGTWKFVQRHISNISCE